MNWESKILTRNPSGIQNLQSYSCDQRTVQNLKIHRPNHKTNDPLKIFSLIHRTSYPFKIYSPIHGTNDPLEFSKFAVLFIGPTTRSNFQNLQHCPFDPFKIYSPIHGTNDLSKFTVLLLGPTICSKFTVLSNRTATRSDIGTLAQSLSKVDLEFLWTYATKFGQNINGNQPTLMRSITWKTTFLIYFCYFLSLSDLKS